MKRSGRVDLGIFGDSREISRDFMSLAVAERSFPSKAPNKLPWIVEWKNTITCGFHPNT